MRARSGKKPADRAPKAAAPKAATPKAAARKAVAKSKSPETEAEESPLLSAREVRSSLAHKAATMAPGDVEELLNRDAEILERASSELNPHPLLRRQTELALQLLSDHASGVAPQIPYYTVSLLAVALFYFLEKDDAIPDWLPTMGTADDALVVELAFEMGAAGITRYCDFKGLEAGDVLPPPNRRA